MPSLSGTVKDSTGAFVAKLVRVYNVNGVLAGAAISDATTGAWFVTTASTEPHFAVVHDNKGEVLLLHMNGANGSTTFTDEYGHAITTGGAAAISTAQSKFGGASGAFNGSSAYLGDSSTNLSFALTGDFTLEGWVYPNAFSGEMAIFDGCQINGSGARANAFVLVVEATTGNLRIYSAGGYSASSSSGLTVTAWNHFAMSRVGTALRFFIEGALVLTLTNSTSFHTGGCVIGRYGDSSGGWFNGYLDEYRLINGAGLYTAAFTPPVAAFPSPSTFENALIFDRLVPA